MGDSWGAGRVGRYDGDGWDGPAMGMAGRERGFWGNLVVIIVRK